MNSSELLMIFVIILHILCFFTYPANSQPDFTAYICDDGDGNYTSTSVYKKNLQILLSSLTSNTRVDYGFYNVSIGQYLDEVHGLALCRGDIPTPDCKTCINYAAQKISSVCPVEQIAIGWYETCMIWYSNQDIFKGEMSQPRYNLSSGHVAANPKSFNHTVSNWLMKLASEAAGGDSRRKYATGEVNVSSTLTVHALLQCVPDLEEYDCLNCLRLIVNYSLADCCYGLVGVRAGGPTCNIRYENYKFYQSAIPLPPLVSPPPSLSFLPRPVTPAKGNRGNRRRVAVVTIIPITVACCLIILLCVLVGCYLKRGKKQMDEKFQNEEEGEVEMNGSLQLDLSVLKSATNNFSDSNKLGQGGFGTVYKGVLASTGEVIAVKRLSNIGEKEFKTECLIVAKLQHRNLVKFYGYCLFQDERYMVFEFVSNKSLDLFLFDPLKSVHLDWQKRYKIIGGIARGLLYLHEESRLLVVHRDLKPSNVLLDEEMSPKISDFGMARLFNADQSHANASRIAGTYGYMPPEYVVHGHFSIKTDVFSFGVLILEIITGQKVSRFSPANSGESLLSFAWRNWSEGNTLKVVNSAVMSDCNTSEVLRCIHIGLLCVQENAARRPIMSSVVLMLNSYSMTLPVPSRPAFLVMQNGDMDASVNEASLSNLEPR